ncbi:BTAD domain-containing putative transcriptional regulator [Streptomyces sp. NPDC018059]|uniref:AfsR/SARP family transcriptional regulator n=1 Tax=Streptomyces sp. NPDC018059 TaxID=3365041 RepID=UPI0037A1203E
MLSFRVLGPLEISLDGRSLPAPRGPKVRQVLSLLLMDPSGHVNNAAIIEELWGQDVPRTAISTIRTHIYHLRRALEQNAAGLTPPGTVPDQLIVTRQSGYSLCPDGVRLDSARFLAQAREGDRLLKAGDYAGASDRLREALDLCRGATLADVTCGPVLLQHVRHLEEVRTRALEQRIEADMHRGLHRELVPELRSVVAVHPLNEWMHAQFITALHRSGRRGDALHAYQNVRKILGDELGLEPSLALQRLQRQVLTTAPVG